MLTKRLEIQGKHEVYALEVEESGLLIVRRLKTGTARVIFDPAADVPPEPVPEAPDGVLVEPTGQPAGPPTETDDASSA